MGDILAQKITGGAGLDVARSFQLGAIGAGLDIFRQDWAGKSEEIKDGKIAQAAKAVTSQATWGPIVACGVYAALKIAEGNPGEIVQGVEVRPLLSWPCNVAANHTGASEACVFLTGLARPLHSENAACFSAASDTSVKAFSLLLGHADIRCRGPMRCLYNVQTTRRWHGISGVCRL